MTAFSQVEAFGNPKYGGNPALTTEQHIVLRRKIPMHLEGRRIYLPIESDVENPLVNIIDSTINFLPSSKSHSGLLSVQMEFEHDIRGFIDQGKMFPVKTLQVLALYSTLTQEALYSGLRFRDDFTNFEVDPTLECYSSVVSKMGMHALQAIGENSCTIER